MADYALKNSTPFFREIDKPFFPLDPMGPNWIRQSIIGLIIGLILGSTIIIGKKIIMEALKS
jgi:capsular polysaccharide biosynthesis protein